MSNLSMVISKEQFEQALDDALQYFPGISLKSEQKICLEHLVVERKDVLGVLPTGFGKSLIYQLLPKILSHCWKNQYGETKTFTILVVSPLEMIRKQQVSRLSERGIKAVTLDTSNVDLDGVEIAFGSAEQWLSDRWRSEVASGKLKDAAVLVVDEAHTVETWGTGRNKRAAFRIAFGHIKELRSFLGNKPVLALTATADRKMRKILCKSLALNNLKEVVVSPNNQNIRFSIIQADKRLSCFDWLVSLLVTEKENCPFTIIFCHTVSDIVLVLSTLLMKLEHNAYVDGPGSPHERSLIGVYYSATPECMKRRICNSFGGTEEGKARVVIASTSLGMGVDFPNVIYVIHFGPGRTITEHLQQAGRAGRDSNQAFNVILYQGKHLSQCEQPIRDVIKKSTCIRHLLLENFVDEVEVVLPLHKCCSRCQLSCNCGDGKCLEPILPFDGLGNVSYPLSTTGVGREVSDEDKDCLKEALMEVQFSLCSQSGLTFFDRKGIITHGFSESVIYTLVEKCHSIFNIVDLMECGLISSMKLAIVVLEVFREVFEDIEISETLYQVASFSSPVYNEMLSITESSHTG